MKILVTGFDPFGGERINPAFEVINALSNEIEDVQIIKLEVPTAFYTSIERTIKEIENIKPDIVLCIGQAGGRFSVSIEKVAINMLKKGKSIDDIIEATELPYERIVELKSKYKN